MNCKKIIFILCFSTFLLTERNANAQSYSATFNYKGYEQVWQVPSGVTQLTITAIGAGGGGNDSGIGGGNGATIVGVVTVAPRDVLDIFIGGSGEEGDNAGGGGGGGTFIYDATSDTLLEVAGGGGGNNGTIYDGYNASVTTIPNPPASGGTGENGGAASSLTGGAGGAGFRGNGDTYSPYTGFAGTGGNDFASGFAGGAGGVGNGFGGNGGYAGGGGGGGYAGGGGGSGYAGGGGGYMGGGGGSSFVSGILLSSASPDTSTENGSATITWEISTGIDNITSTTDQITVYPNPSNGQFNIGVSDEEQGVGEIYVEVYNLLGKKVYFQYSVSNTPFLVNLSAQSNGIYFYRIIDKNSNVLGEGKMVIQK